jgi:hypothetical protein
MEVIMKINLFYNNIYIKSVRIKNTESYERIYKIHVIGKRKIFGLNNITIWLQPTRVINISDKEIDINCTIYEGALLQGGLNE